MSRTGRRPGPGGTREEILGAARAEFARRGYDGTTVRGIAAAARVDPKLVLHYFESKDGVFKAAMEFPFDPAEEIPRLLEPGLDDLGVRLVRFFVQVWDSPAGTRAHAMMRSMVSNDSAAALIKDFVRREILARLAEALELDHPEVRASLAASQMIGLAMLRYVVKVEPLASAPPADLAAWIGPTLQRYFTDPAATRPGRRAARSGSRAATRSLRRALGPRGPLSTGTGASRVRRARPGTFRSST